jgi:hypothetical protein
VQDQGRFQKGKDKSSDTPSSFHQYKFLGALGGPGSYLLQLLKDGVENTHKEAASEVCDWIGKEMLLVLKRFKAALIQRSPRRGGNPIFVRLIRQVWQSRLVLPSERRGL